jgi:hypothetical protein
VKRFLALILAIAGAGIMIWAASSILVTHHEILGYHAMYPGLVGVGLLTVGLIFRQE